MRALDVGARRHLRVIGSAHAACGGGDLVASRRAASTARSVATRSRSATTSSRSFDISSRRSARRQCAAEPPHRAAPPRRTAGGRVRRSRRRTTTPRRPPRATPCQAPCIPCAARPRPPSWQVGASAIAEPATRVASASRVGRCAPSGARTRRWSRPAYWLSSTRTVSTASSTTAASASAVLAQVRHARRMVRHACGLHERQRRAS